MRMRLVEEVQREVEDRELRYTDTNTWVRHDTCWIRGFLKKILTRHVVDTLIKFFIY